MLLHPAYASSPPAQIAFDRAVAADIGANGQSDPAAALDWYNRAANADLPAAQFNAALMYDSGRGAARDAARAAMWYAAAAAHGDPRAAFSLGRLYANGDGVPRNEEAAAAWFAFAARHGIRTPARMRAPGAEFAPQLPADPVRPANNTALTPCSRDVALVWTQPADPGARAYVELVARIGHTQHTVFAGFVPTTAISVPLPRGKFDYAWRVLMASPRRANYVASAWANFSAEIGAQPASTRVAQNLP